MPLSKSPLRTKLPARGFGLVELMVSISIMVLVMTVILTRQRAFDGSVLLRNQAYEVAFILREAQLLAVSGVVEVSVDPAEYRQYGVQFDASAGTFLTFRDANADGAYTTVASGDEQIGAVGQLDPRFRFENLTIADGSSPNLISVTFERPNFDALFREQDGTASNVIGPLQISIVPKTGGSAVRVVEVTSAGYIAVPANN